jgi:cytochrome b
MDDRNELALIAPYWDNKPMKRTLIYDLPTRIFHWIFAPGFLAAFLIAKTSDDESGNFPIHMLIGMTLSLSVLLRVTWGFFGSRYARFSSFVLSPQRTIQYLRNVFSRKRELYEGHNPASSWAGLLLLVIAFSLGFTGFTMVTGDAPEIFEELHELLALSGITIALLHVAGITLHTLNHKDPIGLSMIFGTKNLPETSKGISNSHRGVGALFLALVLSYATYLATHFDRDTQTLHFFGQDIQLGEE